MKAIAVIVLEYPPVVGGIARYTADLVAFMARAWTVRVFRVGHAGEAVSKDHPIDGWIDPAHLHDHPEQVADRLRREEIDRVVFNHIDLAGPRILQAFRRTGLSCSTFIYGADIFIRRPPRAHLRLYVTALLMRHRIVISEGTRALAQRRLPLLSTRLVLPGIEYAGPATTATGRNPGRGIVAVGRFVRRKGFDTLLDAVAVLAGKGLKAPVTLIGDGPDRAWLAQRAQELGLGDTVTLRSGLSDEQVRRALREHRVFCLLPRQMPNGDVEGFGIVFLEAAREGLPVVAGRSGGVPDAVSDGVNGFLVDPTRPDEAADRLERLLTDDALWRRMSEASLPWFESFCWSRRDPRHELAFLDA